MAKKKTVERLAKLIEEIKTRHDEMKDTAETLYDEGWDDLAQQVQDYLGFDQIDEITLPEAYFED